ncbi:hypothetical protein OBCHQ24_06575 [Oceanobacillus iheyensis]|nr:hypothetical protein OBCHQ24_06575 [Oceanobacillus iheyensis]
MRPVQSSSIYFHIVLARREGELICVIAILVKSTRDMNVAVTKNKVIIMTKATLEEIVILIIHGFTLLLFVLVKRKSIIVFVIDTSKLLSYWPLKGGFFFCRISLSLVRSYIKVSISLLNQIILIYDVDINQKKLM